MRYGTARGPSVLKTAAVSQPESPKSDNNKQLVAIFPQFQAKWDEHDNQTRLAERISSVNRWKETLDKCLADIDEEIDALAKVCWEGRWLQINRAFRVGC